MTYIYSAVPVNVEIGSDRILTSPLLYFLFLRFCLWLCSASKLPELEIQSSSIRVPSNGNLQLPAAGA